MFFLPPLVRFPKAQHLPKVRALPPALLSAAAAHQGSQGEGIRTERLCRVCWKRNGGFGGGNHGFFPSIYSFVTLPICNPWCWNIYNVYPQNWLIFVGQMLVNIPEPWGIWLYKLLHIVQNDWLLMIHKGRCVLCFFLQFLHVKNSWENMIGNGGKHWCHEFVTYNKKHGG